MRIIRQFGALTSALLLLSGCASSGARAPAAGRLPTGGADRTMIVVANYHLSEVIVDADDGSGRVRLGRVGSMRTERFAVPRTFVGNGQSLQVVARPIGSGAEYITSSIPIHPRQYVQLNVMNNLAISNWAVWPR